MLTAEMLDEIGDLAEVEGEWDALAVANRSPFVAPAWMLAWWRHAAPVGSRLRVVVVRDRSDVVAIAPFFALTDRLGITRYRLLGAGTSLRALPLARVGEEAAAAVAIAAALRRATPFPDVIAFDGTPVGSPWIGLLRDRWPATKPPWVHRLLTMPAPTLDLSGRDYAGWLASRSRNFRQQLGRRRRQLLADGAVYRLADGPEDVRRGLRTFALLHHARWSGRGGSGVLTPAVEAMLEEVAERLAGTGRLRLWLIEVGGRPVSAQLFVAAGGELSYWLGGFDDDRAAQQPALQAIVAAVEHAAAAGDHRVDLGGGGQSYKYRLANGEETLEWSLLLPPGRRRLLARASVAPQQAWRGALSRLPPDLKDRVKRRLGRPVSG